ncbi:T9SS type A sorting domain-containing protein [bacterium]|nr:T9SS type A sorting domain-containing protein [bacterium]
MLKIAFISVIILALSITSIQPGYGLSHTVGLSADQTETASIVSETSSSIRLSFTPPPSSELLTSNFSSSTETAYNLNEGFINSDSKKLPAITYWVVVPPQANVELKITNQNGRRLSLTGDFISDVKIDGSSDAFAFNALEGFNPPHAASMGKPVIMRGVRMVPVTVYPLQLNDGEATAIENNELTVDLKMSQGNAVNPITIQRSMNYSAGFANIIRSSTINPPQSLNPRRDPAETKLSRLLILYPAALDDDGNAEDAVAEINNYADLKRRMGYLVDVVSVDIENEDSEHIREDYIREYYEADPPVEFVTIIGNESEVELAEAEDRNEELYFPSFDLVIIVDEDEVRVKSEHGYTTLEGDDEASDIILSRMKVPNYERLVGVLRKTIEYQANPYTDDEAWFTHSLVTVEQDEIPPAFYYDLAYWERDRLSQNGYDDVDVMLGVTEEMVDDIKAIFEEGVSVAFGEGMLSGCVQDTNWVQWEEENLAATGAMNSFNIANISDYNMERMYPFFASALPNENNGCIAGMGIYNIAGHSPLMTPIIGSALTAMVFDDVYVSGYLQIITKLHLLALSQREGLGEFYEQGVMDEYRLHWTLGDPTVDVYSELPVQISVIHPNEDPGLFTIGKTSLVLQVIDPDEESVPDAVVCIRQEDGIQYVMNTNAEGIAAFTIPEGLEEGELDITAYKHNCIMYMETVDVIQGEINLILADAGFDDSETGDDDGVFRNGEEVVLVLSLTNTGDAGVTVTANLSCDIEWLTFENEEIEFDDIGSNETVAYSGAVSMTLDQSCPDGTVIRIQADIIYDNENLTSVAFEIETGGPLLTVDHLDVNDAEFIPGGQDVTFSPILINNGTFETTALQATLESLDERVEITAAERDYEAVEANGGDSSPAEPFMLNIDPLFIPGNAVTFRLCLSNDDGYENTLEFSKIVIPREAGEPQGPDDYGYLCFDCLDTTWLEAPVYNWREINWEVEGWEFSGDKFDINLEIDSTTVLDLPFAFQYYGEQFENIMVNTNGWASFGTELEEVFESAYNQPIPGYGAPDGQLCILWQQIFDYGGNSYDGIYYHYIEEDGIFVIEWSQVELLNEEEPEHPLSSFQILLFDPEIYQTATNDGEIVFQYKEYHAATGNNYGLRYATIGIRNLTGDGGLQYSYWNELSDQAHPISDEFAIKFTTSAQNEYGNVTGRVVYAEDENTGIEGINISNIRMHSNIQTDEQGYFTAENLRIGTYEGVIVSGEGYNSDTLSFEIEADRETDLGNIPLTHPEIAIETRPGQMNPNETTRWRLKPDGTELQLEFEISNQGNGNLDYNATIVNEDGNESDYENVEFFQISQLLTEGNCFGLTYIDTLFYIPGRNRYGDNGRGHQVYVVSKTGQYVRRFAQPDFGSDHGIKFLTFDGDQLWGSLFADEEERMRLVSIDLNGNQTGEIEIQGMSFKYAMPLEFIPERNTFLLAESEGSNIYEMDEEGGIINEFTIHFPGVTPIISGLAWNYFDPDGMNLYLIDWNDPYPGWDPPDDTLSLRLIKMNLETGDWRFLSMLDVRSNSSGCSGLSLINNHSNISRTMIATVEAQAANNNADLLRIYDLSPNLTFIADTLMSNRSGIVEPDGTINVGMLIATTHLSEVEIPFGVKFIHNAGEDIFYPMVLHITDSSNTYDRDDVLEPVDFQISSVSPNPFNASVRINFTVDRNELTTLRLYDLLGREVAVIFEGEPEIGSHSMVWSGRGMPSGIYFLRLEMEGRARTVKTAILK